MPRITLTCHLSADGRALPFPPPPDSLQDSPSEKGQHHSPSFLFQTLRIIPTDLAQWLDTKAPPELRAQGGGLLARTLFHLDLVDALELHWHPTRILGHGPTLAGPSQDFLPASRHFQLTDCQERLAGTFTLNYSRASRAKG